MKPRVRELWTDGERRPVTMTTASPGPARQALKPTPTKSVSSPASLSPALVDYSALRDPLYLGRPLANARPWSSHGQTPARRRKRTMTPPDKKDTAYWNRRRKNNESAKRSRETRRLKGLILESRFLALREENAQLRAQLINLQHHSRMAEASGHSAITPLPAHTHRFWGNSSASAVSATGARSAAFIGGFHPPPFFSGVPTLAAMMAPPQLPSYPIMPTSKSLQHSASPHSYPDQSWGLPGQSQLAMCRPNNWLLQYRPSYLDPGQPPPTQPQS